MYFRQIISGLHLIVIQQKVEMVSPHIQLDAVIDNDSLKGDIRLPVTLR